MHSTDHSWPVNNLCSSWIPKTLLLSLSPLISMLLLSMLMTLISLEWQLLTTLSFAGETLKRKSETSWTVALNGTESAVLGVKNVGIGLSRPHILSGTWEISRKCHIFESHNNTWEADMTPPSPLTRTVGTIRHKGSWQYSVVYGSRSSECWSLMVQGIF